MSTRLAHQRAAQPVVMLLKEATLLQDAGAGRIRNPAMDDAEGLALGVGVDDVEDILLAHGEAP